MAVSKIDGEYFLFCGAYKVEIPVNLDDKMYCIKGKTVYYVEGAKLSSFPNYNIPICKNYSMPIKNLMVVNNYVVLIFDYYVIYDKKCYSDNTSCHQISNVTKVLYIGNNDEFIYMQGNSIYEITDVTKKVYGNRWNELETLHILEDYCIVNAFSNGDSIKFLSTSKDVYSYYKGKISMCGTAKRKGNHYVYKPNDSVCWIFCPKYKHIFIGCFYTESKIKKIRSNDGGVIVTFKDGKKILYNYNVEDIFGHELQ